MNVPEQSEPAPVRAERIPHASAPVRLPEVREELRARVNVIVGLALIVVDAALVGLYFGLGLAG